MQALLIAAVEHGRLPIPAPKPTPAKTKHSIRRNELFEADDSENVGKDDNVDGTNGDVAGGSCDPGDNDMEVVIENDSDGGGDVADQVDKDVERDDNIKGDSGVGGDEGEGEGLEKGEKWKESALVWPMSAEK